MNKIEKIKEIYNKHINNIINSTTQTHDEALTQFAVEVLYTLHENKETLFNEDIFVTASKEYDKQAYQGQFAGDNPSKHFYAGINWLKSYLNKEDIPMQIPANILTQFIDKPKRKENIKDDSPNSSLLNRQVIYKDKVYTIIDVHNTGNFCIINDKYESIIGLDWENVKLVVSYDELCKFEDISSKEESNTSLKNIKLYKRYFLDVGSLIPIEVEPVKFNNKEVLCRYLSSSTGRTEMISSEIFEMNGYKIPEKYKK